MNYYENNPFMMNFDGLRGCIISDKFTDFTEYEEPKPSHIIDIIEIKDTACDARFPDESKLLTDTRNKSLHLSSFEKLCHRSKIPRITKSNTKKSNNSLFSYHQGAEAKIKVLENTNERPLTRSKLPIRENHHHHHHKLLKSKVNIDVKIADKNNSLDPQVSPARLAHVITHSNMSNDSMPPIEMEIDTECSSTGDRKHYQKAQQIGSTIGKKISSLLEHIRKKQIASDSTSHPDNAIPIMKKLLRRDLTTKNVPQAKKNIFPQFYIGSTPSQLKLFRLGDEWTDV